MDIKNVSGMLGHFSTGITLDTYAHVPASAQKDAAKMMGNVLGMCFVCAKIFLAKYSGCKKIAQNHKYVGTAPFSVGQFLLQCAR